MNSFPNKGLALAASLLLIASTGEAFSLRAKLTSPNAATPSPPPPRRTTTVATFGSLRDILESPGGVDGDGKSDGGGGVDPRAGGFGNLINFSRSKFSDTKFRSRGSVTGSSRGDERGGLHVDRLSAFSFATASQKSQSEGSPSSSSGGGIDAIDDVDGDDAPDGGDAADDDARGAAAGRRGKRYDDVAADNFNNMVGTFYSKRKFPSRERGRISDARDERGLHGDRLSTFSFSSSQPVPKKNTVVPEEEYFAGESSDDIPSDVGGADPSFGVDNFHNQIEISMRKPSQASRPDPSFNPDGLDNHADRLSTFSLSTTREDAPGSSGAKSVSSGGGAPLRAVNHDDRLGTFSFASTDPQSGSTSVGGTSASSPLPDAGESNIRPPGTKAAEGAGPSGGSNGYIITGVGLASSSPDRARAPPARRGGSLSSIASSVSIKSRNDRIRDIKEATDPKLLHPDGMNVSRLNSKGNVMTLSGTGGRMNIFQRIDKAEREIGIDDGDGASDEDPRDVDDGSEYGTSGSVLEDIADAGVE
jgi:hypothetical protein